MTLRREAEERCRHDLDGNFTIDGVYERLSALLHLPEGALERLKRLEIEAEVEYAVPRRDMAACFYDCLEKGKRVYLITDTHLPHRLVVDILEKCGVRGYEDILVSNRYKKSKADGAMWRHYHNLTAEKKRLHIGDNEVSDVLNPGSRGIAAFRVMSGYDLLLNSTVRRVAAHARSVSDNLVLGLFIEHLFNSPFVLSKSPRPAVSQEFIQLRLPVFRAAHPELPDLAHERAKKGPHRKGPVPRAGRVFSEGVFDKMVGRLGVADGPETIYFKTSRRMASVASIRTREDIFETLEDSFSGSARDLLRNRLGIDPGRRKQRK